MRQYRKEPCSQCGEPMTPGKSMCRACFVAGKPLATATCARCGGRFRQRKTESANEFATRRFCSRRCAAFTTPHDAPEARFWAKVARRGPDDCWLWTASNQYGYGRFWAGYERGRMQAHRFAYELLVGPIPDGLVIDHLCRTPACVNPAHLEPVTDRENILRGEAPSVTAYRTDTCKRGHPLAGPSADVYLTPSGTRRCRACCRERRAERMGAEYAWQRWRAATREQAA